MHQCPCRSCHTSRSALPSSPSSAPASALGRRLGLPPYGAPPWHLPLLRGVGRRGAQLVASPEAVATFCGFGQRTAAAGLLRSATCDCSPVSARAQHARHVRGKLLRWVSVAPGKGKPAHSPHRGFSESPSPADGGQVSCNPRLQPALSSCHLVVPLRLAECATHEPPAFRVLLGKRWIRRRAWSWSWAGRCKLPAAALLILAHPGQERVPGCLLPSALGRRHCRSWPELPKPPILALRGLLRAAPATSFFQFDN
jgi:hypothetical protein